MGVMKGIKEFGLKDSEGKVLFDISTGASTREVKQIRLQGLERERTLFRMPQHVATLENEKESRQWETEGGMLFTLLQNVA
jgi:hypothetical protein